MQARLFLFAFQGRAGRLAAGYSGVNMRRFWTAFSALMLAPLPALAQTAPLQPAGEWRVESEAETCRLLRDFGSGRSRVTLYFNTYGPDESYRVTLAGAGVPRNTGKAMFTQVTFGTGAQPTEVIAIAGRSGNDGLLSFHLTGDQAAFRYYRGWSIRGDFVSEVDWPADLSLLTLANNELPETSINLGDMAGPLEQLRNCQFSLAASWGWEQERLSRIAQTAEPKDTGVIIDLMRMPPAMVVNRVSLIAQLRLMVDAEGQGSDCVVQSPPLDERAQRDLCRPLIAERQFEPARDAEGNAVPSLFRMHYTYFIFD